MLVLVLVHYSYFILEKQTHTSTCPCIIYSRLFNSKSYCSVVQRVVCHDVSRCCVVRYRQRARRPPSVTPAYSVLSAASSRMTSPLADYASPPHFQQQQRRQSLHEDDGVTAVHAESVGAAALTSQVYQAVNICSLQGSVQLVTCMCMPYVH